MKLGLGHFVDRAMYQDYLRRLDVRAVLSHYGAENQREEPGADGTTEVIHSCLLDKVDPHHAHGDSNPSAAANIEKKLFICYSYWAGDLIQLIMRMEGKDTITGVLPVLGAFLGEATESAEDITAEIDAIFAAAESEYQPPPPVYSDRLLAPWAVVHPYLAERGIDVDTASRLKIGWREEDNRIVIPHFWENRLVGWQARTVPDRPGQWPGTADPVPKYKSSFSFPKSSTLYNYDQARTHNRCVVVESPFSVIKAEALGIPGVVATFGAKVSRCQHDLLAAFDRVTVWMDGDTAGRGAERRIVRALARRVDLYVVTPDAERDLGDCATREEIESKLEAARPAWMLLSEWDREDCCGR